MDKCWIEFSFPVPAGEIDLISDLLYTLGCIGVNVEERELDTFTVPAPDEDIPSFYQIKAYFSDTENPNSQLDDLWQDLRNSLPLLTREQMTSSQLQQEDWAEGWKQHFTAIRFGARLVVKPTWEKWDGQPGDAVVSLDPGMAFGTGSHETTRLCLQALADQFAAPSVPGSVLDVGTGSGILAIAAARLGASRVVGCEIDPDACRVAEENVVLNRSTDRVEITDRPLDEIEGEYDLVIANIMAEENVRLAELLVAHLATGGALILSGILKEKELFVRGGFSRFALTTPEVSYENDWCCLCYRQGTGA